MTNEDFLSRFKPTLEQFESAIQVGDVCVIKCAAMSKTQILFPRLVYRGHKDSFLYFEGLGESAVLRIQIPLNHVADIVKNHTPLDRKWIWYCD